MATQKDVLVIWDLNHSPLDPNASVVSKSYADPTKKLLFYEQVFSDPYNVVNHCLNVSKFRQLTQAKQLGVIIFVAFVVDVGFFAVFVVDGGTCCCCCCCSFLLLILLLQKQELLLLLFCCLCYCCWCCFCCCCCCFSCCCCCCFSGLWWWLFMLMFLLWLLQFFCCS